MKRLTTKNTKKARRTQKNNYLRTLGNYVLKTFAFLAMCIIILPLIIPITIYVLFVTAFLDASINIVPLLAYIGKKIFKDKDEDEVDEEEFEDDEIDENDWELENPHDIIEIKK